MHPHADVPTAQRVQQSLAVIVGSDCWESLQWHRLQCRNHLGAVCRQKPITTFGKCVLGSRILSVLNAFRKK